MPQPRHRVTASIKEGEAKVHAYEAPSKHAIHLWKGHIRSEAHRAMEGKPPYQLALSLLMVFYQPRPKSFGKKHYQQIDERADGRVWCAKNPDVDNLQKAVLDACKLVVFVDDRLICDVWQRKFYANENEQPGCFVQYFIL